METSRSRSRLRNQQPITKHRISCHRFFITQSRKTILHVDHSDQYNHASERTHSASMAASRIDKKTKHSLLVWRGQRDISLSLLAVVVGRVWTTSAAWRRLSSVFSIVVLIFSLIITAMTHCLGRCAGLNGSDSSRLSGRFSWSYQQTTTPTHTLVSFCSTGLLF